MLHGGADPTEYDSGWVTWRRISAERSVASDHRPATKIVGTVRVTYGVVRPANAGDPTVWLPEAAILRERHEHHDRPTRAGRVAVELQERHHRASAAAQNATGSDIV